MNRRTKLMIAAGIGLVAAPRRGERRAGVPGG